MSNGTPKASFDSISSRSIDPGLRDLQASNIFGGRKSSFDYVNISKVKSNRFRILINFLFEIYETLLMHSFPISMVQNLKGLRKISSIFIIMIEILSK